MKICQMHPKVNILGTHINSIRKADLLDALEQVIVDWRSILEASRATTQICITPTNSILAARKQFKLQAIYNAAEWVICDGVPVKWAANFLGTPILERITGLDLLPDLIDLANKKSFSVFLLGASPGVGEQLKNKIEAEFPNCQVKGIYVPPFMAVFSEAENKRMLDAVNQSQADILLVSLTAPKQDIWIAEHKQLLQVPLSIGIGGAFEVMAGLVPRAPKWMQTAGLEWLYRLIQEPKRMYRRYLIEAPLFIPLIILQKLFKEIDSNNQMRI
jgi:N-acetylglucosaminyldiphosphoundecaprenol N-acetyl-beta-D-mannosaminyltransferase